jgi:hypothetical protein
VSGWQQRMTAFPLAAPGLVGALSEEEPVTVDGMRVVFDEKVALYPVTLEPARDDHEEADA